VLLPRHRLLAAGGQLFLRELADRFQHRQARFAIRLVNLTR